jgi:hypothetical protein
VWFAEMSIERLTHIAALLESGADLPPASHRWLLDAINAIIYCDTPSDQALGLLGRKAIAERDQVIRENAPTLGIWSHSGQARLMAGEAKRLHQGRRTSIPWLASADRIHRLPETPRQYHNILK